MPGLNTSNGKSIHISLSMLSISLFTIEGGLVNGHQDTKLAMLRVFSELLIRLGELVSPFFVVTKLVASLPVS